MFRILAAAVLVGVVFAILIAWFAPESVQTITLHGA
jgi:hypothetical protein